MYRQQPPQRSQPSSHPFHHSPSLMLPTCRLPSRRGEETSTGPRLPSYAGHLETRPHGGLAGVQAEFKAEYSDLPARSEEELAAKVAALRVEMEHGSSLSLAEEKKTMQQIRKLEGMTQKARRRPPPPLLQPLAYAQPRWLYPLLLQVRGRVVVYGNS